MGSLRVHVRSATLHVRTLAKGRSDSLCSFSLSRAHKLKSGRVGGKGVSRGTRRSSWFSFVGGKGKALSALGDGKRDADRRCADEPIDTYKDTERELLEKEE